MLECWKCGCEVDVVISPNDQKKLDEEYCGAEEIDRILGANAKKRVFCEKCQRERKSTYEKKIAEYRRLKNEIMFERALCLIEKQNVNMLNYKAAADVVADFISKNNEKLFTPEWETAKCFDSADEVATAIILIENEIKTEIQKNIAGAKVDFCLPTLKIVLEIDGELFHKGKELKESRRDAKIRQALGHEWEVVRIPTAYIHKNIEMLPSAIKAIKTEKQRLRKLNGGIIPQGFSKRDDCTIKDISKKLS